jgi:hypothetical protein
MMLKANYVGYKFNRTISQPSGYRFFSNRHPQQKEEVTHIACGNENSSVALWSEKTPSRVLAGDGHPPLLSPHFTLRSFSHSECCSLFPNSKRIASDGL